MNFLWNFQPTFFLTFFTRKVFLVGIYPCERQQARQNWKLCQAYIKELSFPLSPVKFEGKFCARYRFELLARYKSRENPLGSVFAQNFVNFQSWHAICQVALLWALLNKHWQYWNHVFDGGNRRVALKNFSWFLILQMWSLQSSI